MNAERPRSRQRASARSVADLLAAVDLVVAAFCAARALSSAALADSVAFFLSAFSASALAALSAAAKASVAVLRPALAAASALSAAAFAAVVSATALSMAATLACAALVPLRLAASASAATLAAACFSAKTLAASANFSAIGAGFNVRRRMSLASAAFQTNTSPFQSLPMTSLASWLGTACAGRSPGKTKSRTLLPLASQRVARRLRPAVTKLPVTARESDIAPPLCTLQLLSWLA